jgi:Tfp pilus assembly protein PilN
MDAVEQVAQLAEELAHADGLITKLVDENEQLRAELIHKDRIIGALSRRAQDGRALTVVEGGRSAGRCG